MKNTETARRRDRILSLLSSHASLSATALAERLAVTVQTIRSDLRMLDEEGIVRRRHGSAHLLTPGDNIGYQPRMAVARDEKIRIGEAVAALIPPGASVALGTGTTVEACARALARHEGLSVFTNNIHAVLALQLAPKVSVSLAGGAVRLRDLDFIGSESVEFFARLRPDFAVFSVGGISAAGDLLDFNMEEVRARRAIFDCARHRILVVDQSKIGRAAPHSHGKLWAAETLVCGREFPDAIQQDMHLAGRRLVRA
ncbi:DeoR/GlpR family DNA-binding transcription regulator [Phaeovulum sp. W22_SRMD_FR3]|uniref:DeoR/GlpR family DNA-binding transcription regulator n=1 Tax=Phaeovulum sp. W22_SRMD_FR3 TaxID=3240274 RepID=UPI003F9552F4